LRPRVFDVDKVWLSILAGSMTLLLAGGIIGAYLFYSQYFETYKKTDSSDYSSLIEANRLKSATQKRMQFVNEQIEVPADPAK
jgi:uncharacterized membrane protein